MAETKKDGMAAFDFVETCGVKCDKAVERPIRDPDALLAFYDFSAEQWKYLCTTDAIDKRLFLTSRRLRKSLEVHSFVRPGCGSFFRPGHRSRSRRAQGRSRLAAFAASARLGLDRPEHGGRLPGTDWPARLEVAVSRDYLSGAGDFVAKRDVSTASVTGVPILSCRTEAPARPPLADTVSIATRIARSFVPPARQSTSRGLAAP
ncbi:hypothetical protein [Bradyrhizobium sp. CSA207]|uniref:hypothetical protein n=1 Tax=Bradyrhizobium sp. CSA207 TaxID=2698826 RepID=UPI0023B09AF3|nr:hypothetical protein [Bradyrhizobium sp. CSA207]